MPANFKQGDKVKQAQPAPFAGEVVKFGLVENELGYLVADGNGNEHWFKESDLEPVVE
jgi:hypothetical protein